MITNHQKPTAYKRHEGSFIISRIRPLPAGNPVSLYTIFKTLPPSSNITSNSAHFAFSEVFLLYYGAFFVIKSYCLF